MSTQRDLPQSFRYEQCDVPAGVSLAEWRVHHARSQRKAQVAGGIFAAIATLGPTIIAFRNSRSN